MRILLVEDEPRMANVIAKGLREQSYAVDVAQDGDAGLYQAAINDYDVIVLDVLLPQRDGFEVCRELRKRGNATPVLMLTALWTAVLVLITTSMTPCEISSFKRMGAF